MTERIQRLKHAVQTAAPGVCPERAVLWTRYCRKAENRLKSSPIQMAEALGRVLAEKSIRIWPDEIIVGNFSSKRVGGSLFPELHGLPVMLDIFKFSSRETNPLQISGHEILSLLKTVPFWLLRFLALRTALPLKKKIRFILNQLQGHYYIINEAGGISHVAPDYEKLITLGTDAIAREAEALQRACEPVSGQWVFYEGVKTICEGLAGFGERYAALAEEMALSETDPVRKKELNTFARICRQVPRYPARSFREAVQALFFAQIAINLESLDNSVCPGRMDQYLWPFYKKDLANGVLTREGAREILMAFAIKMAEIIPVFSKLLTSIHGGMFNGQVVTVGGTDADGHNAVNELSYLFLEVMDELRMRQPNFHARVTPDDPATYTEQINALLAGGSNSPALYNDDVIVKTLCSHGYSLADARNYTAVGCVEPVCQGKSFSSTDAAILNVPILLELALNRGKPFGSSLRPGLKTRAPGKMRSMADLQAAFEAQLRFQLERLIEELQAVEIANRRFHPTPLTSVLLDGCLESGTCSTAGGARYNFSGIQCVAPADTGDALYAIEQAVFVEKKLSLPQLVNLLRQDLADPYWHAYLKGLDKYGNDIPAVDRWTVYVVDRFVDVLKAYRNTRGGRYVAGLYSVTTHALYGRVTGAMAHGRKKGASFASGIAPGTGVDKSGPTALLNSVNRLDYTKIANGMNLNLKFDPHTLRGETGKMALNSLLKTYFRNGGMQAQVNVLDPQVLMEARDHPDRHPNLLVRVSGYSAYFNDLTPDMQNEIITRTCLGMG
ncbi:MAG: formate acetyltransferase [Desulfobacterales bacterium]|nr:formate acetyltransferase [Desulfobacterales bacterium]